MRGKKKTQNNKAMWRITCITYWRPSHNLAHHTRTASPWCERGRGSWGCKRWGRPFHSLADCKQRCTRPGVSSGVYAGFLPCCTSLCNLRTCTGSASPDRRRRGENQCLTASLQNEIILEQRQKAKIPPLKNQLKCLYPVFQEASKKVIC